MEGPLILPGCYRVACPIECSIKKPADRGPEILSHDNALEHQGSWGYSEDWYSFTPFDSHLKGYYYFAIYFW